MFELSDHDSAGDGNSQAHEEIKTEQEYVMQLTKNEALFLDDRLTLMVQREGDEQEVYSMRPVQMTAGLAVPLDLMDKIGKAVAFTTNPENQGQEYEFTLDISEAFMIREVASSVIKVDEEAVGYNLKRKVCVLLYGEELQQENRDFQVDYLLKDVNVDFNSVIPDEGDSYSRKFNGS